MKAKLDDLGVVTETLTGYSTGHAVPQSQTDLQRMYDFMSSHVAMPTGIQEIPNSQKLTANSQLYNLQGQRLSQPQKGLNIVNGRKVVIK
jgi:hypothetical protein